MARVLCFRVVEVKVRETALGWRVDAWLLIAGKGRSVHFQVLDSADLPGKLDSACAEAYQHVVGSPLPDTAR